MKMKLLDIMEHDGNYWAIIDTGRGKASFTLNDDGTIYVLSPGGGGALQDTEADFMDDATDEERESLRELSDEIVNGWGEK